MSVPTDTGPQSYNDQRLDDMARTLFGKCVSRMIAMLEDTGPAGSAWSPERMHALAAAADAAASCITPEHEDASDPF